MRKKQEHNICCLLLLFIFRSIQQIDNARTPFDRFISIIGSNNAGSGDRVPSCRSIRDFLCIFKHILEISAEKHVF